MRPQVRGGAESPKARDLNGFAVVTGTQDGSERQIRFGVRVGW